MPNSQQIKGRTALVSKILQSLGQRKHSNVRLCRVATLADAVAAFAERPVSAIALDLISGEFGLDQLATLRARCPHIPILVVRRDEDETLISSAFAKGADDCLTQDELSLGMLMRTVRYLIERHKRYRAELRLTEERFEERKRLSRELHDGVMQSLYAKKMRLQMLASRLRVFDGESSQRALEIADITGDTMNEVRRVSRDLHSSLLDTHSLPDALALAASRLEGQFELQIRVRGQCKQELSLREKHHLYRIFQESMHNAIRHGKAGNVVVELVETPARITLRVQDDGDGFDVGKKVAAGDGLGLRSIRERAQLLGGETTIHSSRSRGTTVCVDLPVATTLQARTAGADSEGAYASDTVGFSARDTLR